MSSKVSEMSRIWVMNKLPHLLEDHKDVKNCNIRSSSKIEIELHNTKGARTTYHKVYTIFEWLRNERLDDEYFIDSNNNAYAVKLASDIPGRCKTYAVASVDVIKKDQLQ